MRNAKRTPWTAIFAPLAATALVAALAPAADSHAQATTPAGSTQTSEARDTLQEAQRVVQRMQAVPGMREALRQARGVFIVPNYARGGAGVVAKGGEGVVLTRLPNGTWSNPAFFNMGGVSVGLQAGASGGQMAFVLMTDKARDAFNRTNNISLNANAGLTVVNYSAAGQASIGKGEDVIAWSGTEGLFAGANVGVTDIFVDNEENRAYYGPNADAQAILAGRVDASRPAATSLKQALPSGRTGTAATTGNTRADRVTAASPTQDRYDTSGSRLAPRADRN